MAIGRRQMWPFFELQPAQVKADFLLVKKKSLIHPSHALIAPARFCGNCLHPSDQGALGLLDKPGTNPYEPWDLQTEMFRSILQVLGSAISAIMDEWLAKHFLGYTTWWWNISWIMLIILSPIVKKESMPYERGTDEYQKFNTYWNPLKLCIVAYKKTTKSSVIKTVLQPKTLEWTIWNQWVYCEAFVRTFTVRHINTHSIKQTTVWYAAQ